MRVYRFVLVMILVASTLVVETGQIPVEAKHLSSKPSQQDGPVETINQVPPEATFFLLPDDSKTGNPALESRLAQLFDAYLANDLERMRGFAEERHIDLDSGTARVILEVTRSPEAHPAGEGAVQIITLADGQTAQIRHAPLILVRDDLAQAIAATGATYETAYRNWVQVRAPLASLQALTQISDVRYVRLPFPVESQVLPPGLVNDQLAPRAGAQTSQGVTLTGVDAWHTAGHDGNGVNLAVFDFGFTGWDARQASGDLPAGGNLVRHDFSASYDYGPPGTLGQEHGTSCAEIAFDMAPGSVMHLYAWGTEVEFGNAVDDYVNNVSGTKVASMSIGWVNAGPYDGTGPINDILADAQAAGIVWAQSAGNYQKQHWSGVADQYGAGDTIAFGSGNVQGIGPTVGSLWNIPGGTTIRLFLEWNDWSADRSGNQNHIDYNMYLLRYRSAQSDWVVVTQSTGNQCTSSSPPVEAIVYTPVGVTRNYGILITRYTGSGVCPNNFGHWMQLFTYNGFYQSGQGAVNSFWYANQCNSLSIPADSDSVISVGATFWNEDGSAPLYGLETFTSFGPRNATGGANPGVAVDKPDVVAPDGVSTVTDGTNDGTNYANGGSGFWGTSAAAPHVAGLIAASWSGRPCYDLTQQRSYIQSQALYKADGGSCGGAVLRTPLSPTSGTQNNRYGWGRVNLGVGALPQPGLWDGGDTDNNWTSACNWDDDVVPASSVSVRFDDTSTKDAIVDASFTVAGVSMDPGYTGSITLGAPLDVNGALTLDSGSLDAGVGDYAINLSGDFTRTGGSFQPRNSTLTFDGAGTQAINASSLSCHSLVIDSGVSLSAPTTLNIGGNLTNDGDFEHNSGTVTFDGSAAQTIGGSVATTFYNLSIDNANGVTLDQSQTVFSTLTLGNGLLYLGSNHLTLADSASIAGSPSDSNMVVATGSGELRKEFSGTGSFTFPVGDDTGMAEYSPVSLDFTSGTFAPNAYAALRLADDKHPALSAASDYLTRYWTVTQSGISDFWCDATFNYMGADVVGNETSIQGGKYDGSSWYALGPVDAGNDRFTGGVNGFSDFSGGPLGPLAVSLADLIASSRAGSILVEWQTVMELDTLGFNLYRATSVEGERLPLNTGLILAQVPGGLGASYNYLDVTVLPGVKYYYWLEVVGSRGEDLYGPVEAMLAHLLYLPLLTR